MTLIQQINRTANSLGPFPTREFTCSDLERANRPFRKVVTAQNRDLLLLVQESRAEGFWENLAFAGMAMSGAAVVALALWGVQ